MSPAKQIVVVTMLVICLASMTACLGGPPECETLGRYQLSEGGERIDAPDGLDELESHKEMTIPKPSPRPPQPVEEGRCLEMPPPIGSS